MRVKAVGGKLVLLEAGHGSELLWTIEDGIFRFRQASSGRSALLGQVRQSKRWHYIYGVGDTGLEPVTFSVSCWRASQLRQSPNNSEV